MVDAAHAVRRAWIMLALYPVSFAAAFVVGEGIVSAFGYSTGGDESVPFWLILLAGVPALVVFAVPGLLSAYYGRRAVRQGEPRGKVPALIGLLVAAGFVALNLLSYLIGLIAG